MSYKNIFSERGWFTDDDSIDYKKAYTQLLEVDTKDQKKMLCSVIHRNYVELFKILLNSKLIVSTEVVGNDIMDIELSDRDKVKLFMSKYICAMSQKLVQVFVERYANNQALLDDLFIRASECSDLRTMRYLNTSVSFLVKRRAAEKLMASGNVESLDVLKLDGKLLYAIYDYYKEQIPLANIVQVKAYVNKKYKIYNHDKDRSPEDSLIRRLKSDIDLVLSIRSLKKKSSRV